MTNTTENKTYNIQFKDTKAIVWSGTWEDYLIDFDGGMDKDNSKTFEIVPAK